MDLGRDFVVTDTMYSQEPEKDSSRPWGLGRVWEDVGGGKQLISAELVVWPLLPSPEH